MPTTTGRNEVWAFEAFRPRLKASKASKASKARRAEARRGGPALGEGGGQRMGRRGKGVAVGVATAVALGTVAFGVDAMSSGPPARNDSARPAVSVSPDPDLVAREALRNASPDEPRTPSPPQSASGGMRPAGEGHEERPGSQPPATHDESPSPSPSAPGDAGGTSQGGGSGAPGGDDGGASDGGNAQGGDGDDGGDEQGGGLLGGLFGALFGGGGHDDDHGGHDDGGRGDHDDGRGHHGGGGHGGGPGGGGHH